MAKKLDNHLVGINDWKEWIDYVEYGESEWSQSGSWYNAYRDTPSKEECDKLCAALSGEVTVYKMA